MHKQTQQKKHFRRPPQVLHGERTVQKRKLPVSRGFVKMPRNQPRLSPVVAHHRPNYNFPNVATRTTLFLLSCNPVPVYVGVPRVTAYMVVASQDYALLVVVGEDDVQNSLRGVVAEMVLRAEKPVLVRFFRVVVVVDVLGPVGTQALFLVKRNVRQK